MSAATTVYAVFADADEAERIGAAVIAERLAACINIFPPVRSIYRWQGEVMRADEVAAILKTRARGAEPLIARICELHSYEVPCAVAWPIDAIPQSFAAWIDASVG
jgi:periplasmic divalent cation tolerance protein